MFKCSILFVFAVNIFFTHADYVDVSSVSSALHGILSSLVDNNLIIAGAYNNVGGLDWLETLDSLRPTFSQANKALGEIGNLIGIFAQVINQVNTKNGKTVYVANNIVSSINKSINNIVNSFENVIMSKLLQDIQQQINNQQQAIAYKSGYFAVKSSAGRNIISTLRYCGHQFGIAASEIINLRKDLLDFANVLAKSPNENKLQAKVFHLFAEAIGKVNPYMLSTADVLENWAASLVKAHQSSPSAVGQVYLADSKLTELTYTATHGIFQVFSHIAVIFEMFIQKLRTLENF